MKDLTLSESTLQRRLRLFALRKDPNKARLEDYYRRLDYYVEHGEAPPIEFIRLPERRRGYPR